MTDILASLMHKGVLSLELVAQDGMRVRADATAPSFRSYGSLLECREQAALHLKAVLAQADDPELTRPRRRRATPKHASFSGGSKRPSPPSRNCRKRASPAISRRARRPPTPRRA